MITQVLKELFSASDIMEAVRDRFCFYTINARLRDSIYIVALYALRHKDNTHKAYLQYNRVVINVLVPIISKTC